MPCFREQLQSLNALPSWGYLKLTSPISGQAVHIVNNHSAIGKIMKWSAVQTNKGILSSLNKNNQKEVRYVANRLDFFVTGDLSLIAQITNFGFLHFSCCNKYIKYHFLFIKVLWTICRSLIYLIFVFSLNFW